MGLEIILLSLCLGAAGLFTVNKTVDVYKHNATLEADKYASCMTATKDARQCRGLE
jgi:predicted metal-binding protein